jgi:hypothetical protein
MSIDVRCDLCEQARDPVWVFRTDRFAIKIDDETTDYPQNLEWGVCELCKDDILANEQERILARRRVALSLTSGAQLGASEFAAAERVLTVLVISFLSCRQKTWPGRPFTIIDSAEAIADLAARGRRY